jgi:hypothetical protein
MTQQRANARALALAHIADNLAHALPAYTATIHDQLRHTTGYPDHTPGAAPATTVPTKPLEGRCTQPVDRWRGMTMTMMVDGVPYTSGPTIPELVDCGWSRPCPEHDRPVTLTPTEHTANLRAHLHNELADIDQTLTTLTLLANELLARARRATPPPPPNKRLCKDGLIGKDGSIEWGNPTCHDLADKAGLCTAHYTAWYRWRKTRNIPVGTMHQPANLQPG